ncbi:MAG: hypothetical protein ACRDF6_12680 [bacterium]
MLLATKRPSGSRSFAITLMRTDVFSAVRAESFLATGGWLGGSWEESGDSGDTISHSGRVQRSAHKISSLRRIRPSPSPSRGSFTPLAGDPTA